MKTKKNLAIAIVLLVSVASFAQNKSKLTIGNAKMDAKKNIMQNLEASSEFSSAGKLFAVAEFKELLSDNNEEYTILAPTNTAIATNSKEKLNDLLEPVNMFHAKDVAAYHIIPGKWLATDFGRLLRTKGTPEVKTASGEILIVSYENGNLFLTDKNGNKAKLIITDALQSNGILHGIDNVFSPSR